MLDEYNAQIQFLHQKGVNILRRRIPAEEDVQQMITGLYSSVPSVLFSSSGEKMSFVNLKACNEAFRIFGLAAKNAMSEFFGSLFPDFELDKNNEKN